MSARKISGTIIHHCRDELGEITVADDGDTRSLYFGDVLQSSIRLGRPDSLVEDYNRAMMSGLMFVKDPRSVLLIGLGGCSLVHFILRNLPECAVDVVEIRQKVIDLAHDFFFLPRESPCLKLFHAAGQCFFTMSGDACRKYDLIILDAFDEGGPSMSLIEDNFLTECRQRMNSGSVCIMNLWSRPRDNFPSLYASVHKAFDGSTLKLIPAEAYWNTLVFAFPDPEPIRDLLAFRTTARMLQGKYPIDFSRFLKYLYRQNLS